MNSHLRTKIGRLTAVFAAVIGGSLVAAAIVLPASPAMASGTSCQYEEAQEGNTCVAVTGSGLHVDSVKGSFVNLLAGNQDDIHIELTGPNGKFIKNCAQTNVTSEETITCTWSPNAPETGGNYCSTTWHNDGDGDYTSYGKACVDVHS
jgi:hypothetical protein